MPLYDYRCEACGASHEIHTKLDAADPPCPSCGATALAKVIHIAPLARMGRCNHTGDPFFSEREVESRYGKDWRETAKTPREGGDRKKDYYTASARR